MPASPRLHTPRRRTAALCFVLAVLALFILSATTTAASQDVSNSVLNHGQVVYDDLAEFLDMLHDTNTPEVALGMDGMARDATDGSTTTTTVDPANPGDSSTTTTSAEPTTTTTTDPNKPWTSVPPTAGYPDGSITYTRRSPVTVKQAFFTRCWYVAIIILVVGVAVLYILLCIWICCHFDKTEQNRAKKVVQRSYEENGYFELQSGSLTSTPQSSATRGRRSSSYEMDMSNNMMYEDADNVSVGNSNPLNSDYYV